MMESARTKIGGDAWLRLAVGAVLLGMMAAAVPLAKAITDSIATVEPFIVAIDAPISGEIVSGTVALEARTSQSATAGYFSVMGPSGSAMMSLTASPSTDEGTVWRSAWNVPANLASGQYAITFSSVRGLDGMTATSEATTVSVIGTAAAAGTTSNQVVTTTDTSSGTNTSSGDSRTTTTDANANTNAGTNTNTSANTASVPYFVGFLKPAANATVSGNVTLSAGVNQPADSLVFVITPPSGSLITVQASMDAASAWNGTWNAAAVPNGTYSIAARAFHAGVMDVSAPLTVTVANATASPTFAAALLQPSSGSVVSGRASFSAKTNLKAVSLKFSVRNAAGTEIALLPATPSVDGTSWTAVWDTSVIANGAYAILANAVTEGATASTDLRSFFVDNASADAVFSLNVTAPAAGAVVSGALALEAKAYPSADALAFLVTSFGGIVETVSATGGPVDWRGSWDATGKPAGTYAVRVKGTRGTAVAESAAVTVSVAGTAGTTQTPTTNDAAAFVMPAVRLSAPAANATVSGSVALGAVSAAAIDGLAFVIEGPGVPGGKAIVAATGNASRTAWSAAWNSATARDGKAVISGIVSKSGREAETGEVTVNVLNAPVTTTTVKPATNANTNTNTGTNVNKTNANVAPVNANAATTDRTTVAPKPPVTAPAPSVSTNTNTNTNSAQTPRPTVIMNVNTAPLPPRPAATDEVKTVPEAEVTAAVREAPKDTAPIASTALPESIGRAATALAAECVTNSIPASRCDAWLEMHRTSPECVAAGIVTKEECVAFLEARHGGTMPGCVNKAESGCSAEIAAATAGLMSSSDLRDLREAVIAQIGTVMELPAAGSDVSEGALPALPPSLRDRMPIWDDQPMAVRIHASPGYASEADGSAHQTVPAIVLLDSDADGLPDDVEVRWGTDPFNADTDGDGYPDAQEAVSGYYPLGEGRMDGRMNPAPVDLAIISGAPIEQPKDAGTESPDLAVTDVVTPEVPGTVTLSGRATPGAVVTVFVYSDLPMVFTASTGSDGTWSYQLDGSLSDGRHEAYVTVTDETGKISQKSSPLSFFVSSARAVSEEDFFNPELSPLEAATAGEPSRQLLGLYVGATALLVLAALVAAYFLLTRKPSASI